MILLIDNYDSFTYNLYQYLSELGAEVRVLRNDQVSLESIDEMAPQKIVISPGPCTPDKAGISNDVIRHFGEKTPTLGVCLGHQCISYAYGGTVGGAGEIMHGKMSMIHPRREGRVRGPTQPLRSHTVSLLGGLSRGTPKGPRGDCLDGHGNHYGS